MTSTTTFDVAAQGEREIVITRAFDAPRELVYRAFTEPALLKRWLGPRVWELTECAIDLRPGGAWRYEMRGPVGATMVISGTYQEVDPPARLVTTEVFDDDWTGGETRNTTTFDEREGYDDGDDDRRLRVDRGARRRAGDRDGRGPGRGLRATRGPAGRPARGPAHRHRGRAVSAGPTDGPDLDAIIDRYRRRADRFEATVSAVPSDRWTSPSPCAGWTARDVVGHVIDMHGVMLRPLDRERSPAPTLTADPLGAFRAARADVEGLLADPAIAMSVQDTPMGPMTVAEHVDGVPSDDLVVHTWDLARATGLDDTIDPDELERMWPSVQSIPEEMRIPGHFGPGIVVFGPAVAVPPDAPLQHRVLGALGRDPT